MTRYGTVLLLACAAGFLAAGCSHMDVKTDYDPTANFAAMKTYRWIPEPDVPGPADPALQEEEAFVRDCVHRAVDRELARKGMRAADTSPDVLLTFATASRDKLRLEGSKEKGLTFRDRLLYPGWVEGNTEIYYDIGTLILDMIDPRNRELLWRGSAEGSLPKDIGPKELEKNIDEAVKKMLETFPPSAAPAPPGRVS